MVVNIYEIETRDGHTLWFAPYPATGEIFWDLNGLLVAFEVSADSTAADEARQGALDVAVYEDGGPWGAIFLNWAGVDTIVAASPRPDAVDMMEGLRARAYLDGRVLKAQAQAFRAAGEGHSGAAK